MTSKELQGCADESSNVVENLTKPENAADETITRGLFLVAAGLFSLSVVGYNIAAILASKNEKEAEDAMGFANELR